MFGLILHSSFGSMVIRRFKKCIGHTAIYIWLKDEYSMCSWDSITVDSLLGSVSHSSCLEAERPRFHVRELTVITLFRTQTSRKNFSNCSHYVKSLNQDQIKEKRLSLLRNGKSSNNQ